MDASREDLGTTPIEHGRLQDAESAFVSMINGDVPEATPEEEPVAEDALSPEEGELEAEESDLDAEADEGWEDEPEEPAYTVKVAGEEIEVPLSELLQGYQRQSDYTRKTQSLAQQRAQIQQQAQLVQQLQSEVQSWQAQREQVEQMGGTDPGPEYWQDLQATDPVRYLIERDNWRETQRQRQEFEAKTAQLQQQAQQYHLMQQAQQLEQQREMLQQLIPEWQDSERASAEKGAIKHYGMSMGYSEGELDQLYDARAVAILRKAFQYDQLMERRSQLKPQPATSLSSASRPTGAVGRKQSDLTKAKQRLAKTGSVQDAQAAFSQLLSRR
jgi:hypothetical protein